jgi:hypothetical protein
MRRHFSYANVAATLALVFSMSGGALAAKHYLISSPRQINPKVLNALKGRNGANGTNGAAGPAGPTGKEGPAGKEAPAGKEGPPGKEGATGKEGTAVIPAITWHPLTLVNEWATYSAGVYGVPSYTKDAEGFVHLSGAMARSTAQTISEVATLPEGYRPAGDIWVRASSTNGASVPKLVDLAIGHSGRILAASGTEAEVNDKFVSLEGVTFYAG